MSCLTCGPSWSTAWYKNAWWLQKEGKPNLMQLEDNIKGDFWDQIKPQLHNVSRIYFTGGEPMMMPDHWKILLYLIEKGLQDKVELHYNTNLSQLKFGKYDVLDLWSKFKHVDLGISIDGVEKDAELIRWGTKWDEVEANLLSLKGYDNIHLGVDSVISLLNIDHVPTMQRHLEKVGIVDGSTIMSYNIAFGPDISITSLPDEIKQRMELYLLDHFNKYECPLKHHMKWGYKQVINFMKEKNTWNRDQFKHLINYRYYFAKDDLLEHLPLVKEMYEHE
jgi:sulfatase maturation enzyme AslB (radical SAM superfamily)